MEKEKRLKEIGSRVVGRLRLHLKDIRGIDSNVRDDEGFVFREELKRSVRIDLRFGTIEQSSQISNAKVGARSSSRSSNVQLEARWNDAHFDLPVRLCDFKDHTACLTITLFGGGSSSSSFRQIARCKLKFLKSKSVGEQCKKMHLCDNVRISHNREKEMWIEAAKSFSVKPFSNGKDRRYESVKALLRKRYGKAAINETNKGILKKIAREKGAIDDEIFGRDVPVRRNTEFEQTIPIRITFSSQWICQNQNDPLRVSLFEYFSALEEANDETLLNSLEATDLGSSTMAVNTGRIVKVFNCIAGLQNGVLETILWKKPKRCVIALLLWTSCCVWPQIFFSLPAWAVAFVLHLRLSGLRETNLVDVGKRNCCLSCGKASKLRCCSGCNAQYCNICKYLYMLRTGRNTWSHVHCLKGPFKVLSERPLSIAAHKRNARSMQNIMSQIVDLFDTIDWMWHQGLKDPMIVRKAQTAAIVIAPICCAIGAVIPLWLVLMFAGWILFLGGNPYVRGVTWFAVFTLRYDSSELDTVLCGNTIDSESEDEGIVFDFEDEGSSSIMTPSPSPISSTGCEVVSEVQQWSWTKLKWTHLAWTSNIYGNTLLALRARRTQVPNKRENVSCPSNSVWTSLWGLDEQGFEYTDGKTKDDDEDNDDEDVDVTIQEDEEEDAVVIPSKRNKRMKRLDSSCPTSDAMWSLAVERFSKPPYSNGSDAKYQDVKAELKRIYGQFAINATNKSRLKYLAKSRGARLKVSNYHKKPRSGDLYRRRLWRRHYRVVS